MAEDEKSELQLPELVRGSVSIFPYAMTFFSYFLNGAVFCSISIPLLWVSENSNQALSLKDLLWETKNLLLVGLQGLGGSTGWLMLCGLFALSVGICLQPFLQIPFFTLNWIADFTRTCINRIRKRSSSTDDARLGLGLYDPAFTDPACDYTKFAEWLQYHRYEKLAWEWELFNYYLSLGAALNVSLASLAVWHATKLNWALKVMLLGVWLVSVWTAVLRSKLQRKALAHYLNRVRKEPVKGRVSN